MGEILFSLVGAIPFLLIFLFFAFTASKREFKADARFHVRLSGALKTILFPFSRCTYYSWCSVIFQATLLLCTLAMGIGSVFLTASNQSIEVQRYLFPHLLAATGGILFSGLFLDWNFMIADLNMPKILRVILHIALGLLMVVSILTFISRTMHIFSVCF